MHAFTRVLPSDGNKVDATAGKDKLVAKVTSGLKGLLGAGYITGQSTVPANRDITVLKTTGSAFENFVRDEYTTLVEVRPSLRSHIPAR